MNVESVQSTPRRAAGNRVRVLGSLLNALAPFIGLLLIILGFSLLHTPEGKPLREFFLTGENFKFIAAQSVTLAVGALGMTLVILSGGIDLSAGSSIALTGVTAAWMLSQGHSPMAATAVAMGAGGLVGLSNGALIGALRMPPFIVTLGTLGIVRGAAKWFSGDRSIPIPRESPIADLMAPFPAHSWLVLAPGTWLVLLLAAVLIGVMQNTIFGRYVYAIGSNEAAATLCGVRVGLYKLLIYGTAGLLFGIAGVFQTARLREGDPTTAAGVELDLIAAVVIGGTTLRGGSGSVAGSVIGALVMAVLRNGSQQAGWPAYIQEIIIGVVIIAAVTLDRFRRGFLANGLGSGDQPGSLR